MPNYAISLLNRKYLLHQVVGVFLIGLERDQTLVLADRFPAFFTSWLAIYILSFNFNPL